MGSPPKTSIEPNWPADKIERRAVVDLIPAARNVRTHSDQQIAQIAASIREWGWTVPVVVDETGSIIAGHGRVRAAETLGLGEVPVVVARGWSDAQKRGYLIADNKVSDNAGWNDSLLKLELDDLEQMGFSLADFFPAPKVQTADAAAQLGGLSYSVIVRCDDEKQQLGLLERFEQEGLKCEALIS